MISRYMWNGLLFILIIFALSPFIIISAIVHLLDYIGNWIGLKLKLYRKHWRY